MSNPHPTHYSDVTMSAMASQITNVSIVSGRDYDWQVDPPHKGPVTRKMSPFNDVIMPFSTWLLSNCRQQNVAWYIL